MQISNTAAVILVKNADSVGRWTWVQILLCVIWQGTVGTLREFNKKAFYRGMGRAQVLH